MDALRPHNGLVAKGLLPRLSELVIVSKEGLVHDSLISFIHAYCLAENRINFRLVKESPPPIWVSRSNILLFFPIFE
jgi:hypothetical protein